MPYPASIVRQLLGGPTPQSDHRLYRDALPVDDVSSQSAPTLIVQNSQDRAVRVSQSQELPQALQRARGRVAQ